MVDPAAWQGTKVLVTGHTGFKGGWLSYWLNQMGADVAGYALAPNHSDSVFQCLNLENCLESNIADINDTAALQTVVQTFEPDVVFHLAAQPLVRLSYQNPVETFATNVLGTSHLLETVRTTGKPCRVIVVTSDKCYLNDESGRRYREDDALGGHDPYSASKAAAEIVTASFRQSFGSEDLKIASARAGNVIGGGDWSEDRLVPDLVRAWLNKDTMTVRNPKAVRPWQHVLEPLSGYLQLAEAMANNDRADAWNFGPDEADGVPVSELIQLAKRRFSDLVVECSGGNGPHEAATLLLDSTKAKSQLGWQPRWQVGEAVERTLDWYQAWHGGEDMRAFTSAQIEAYSIT